MPRLGRLLRNALFASIVGITGVVLGIISVVLGLIVLREEISQLLETYGDRIDVLLKARASIPVLLPSALTLALILCMFGIGLFISKQHSIRTLMYAGLDSRFSWAQVHEGSFKFRSGDRDVIRELPTFYMSKHPVTNEQYKFFLDSNSKYAPPGNWEGRNYPRGKAKHPVVEISRRDAEGYCRWLSDVTSKGYRLPDQYEWEKAARAEEGQMFPWSEQTFDPRKCNSAESKIGDTTPVDQYDNGKSPYECYDIVGNVSEWTKSTEDGLAVIRGSSYKTEKEKSDCYYRAVLDPDSVSHSIGFRIVKKTG